MIEMVHRSLQVTCVGGAGVYVFFVAIQVCFISISFDLAFKFIKFPFISISISIDTRDAR